MTEVIEEIGEQKVICLMTDNANAMKSAWAKVRDTYPHIEAVGCSSHVFNLIFHDVLKEGNVGKLTENCRSLINAIKRSPKLNALLKENGSNVSLKNPCKTR